MRDDSYYSNSIFIYRQTRRARYAIAAAAAKDTPPRSDASTAPRRPLGEMSDPARLRIRVEKVSPGTTVHLLEMQGWVEKNFSDVLDLHINRSVSLSAFHCTSFFFTVS